jgi:hypothetical protein
MASLTPMLPEGTSKFGCRRFGAALSCGFSDRPEFPTRTTADFRFWQFSHIAQLNACPQLTKAEVRVLTRDSGFAE